MKIKKVLIISIIPLLLAGCKLWNINVEKDPAQYKDKKVNLYREAGKIDKKISLRFYEKTPNVPYISVDHYFKEFFDTVLYRTRNEYTFSYLKASNVYIAFDSKKNIFSNKNLNIFDSHPDFKSNTGEIFLKYNGIDNTKDKEQVINLNNYSIDVHDDGYNAFLPLTLLSKLFGGKMLYNITYNGKDVYVLDYQPEIVDVPTKGSTFGEQYFSYLNNTDTTRPKDLVKYTYNELCFAFDNLRGYTKQLVLGDENLLSLGLNKTLERYAPKTKEYLLSTNKIDYLEGMSSLFFGVGDGGHTGILSDFEALNTATNRQSEEEFVNLQDRAMEPFKKRTRASGSIVLSRISKSLNNQSPFNYHYDEDNKISYIIFNKFVVDYDGWDNFYKGLGNVPVETDTYAFVRQSLYKALEDGAENVVLDISFNGGGNSFALEGIIGLLNQAKSDFSFYDTCNKYKLTEHHLIDINLDNKFNNLDKVEADKFKSLNIGVLTSYYSFSCANLLPAMLKNLGYKIIGDQSGGGSCAISVETTADGIEFQRSTYVCFVDKDGNNVDSGIPVDLEIPHPQHPIMESVDDYSAYYDYEAISNYLSSAY